MRSWTWLVLMLVGTLGTAGEPEAAGRTRTADLTLRYVNDSVISYGDVLQRNSFRVHDNERRGRPQPSNREENLVFFLQSLNELTDEELLIQYGRQLAAERGFQLIDHERISQQVMERARASGRGRSLREQAEDRRHIEREQIIGLVTGYFESRIPHISPQDIERSFQEREQEFRRPARAKVYQIVLRPNTPGDRQEVRQARLAIFRAAQDVTDTAIRTISESRIEAYTVATVEEQERLLAEAVQEIARQVDRVDLDAGTMSVVKKAGEVEARAASMRDPEATRQALETLRGELVGKDLAAFAEAAKKVSQGPGAADGGLLGWVEPGTYQPTFDEVIFTIKPGELSPVFVTDRLVCLVVVSERNEPSMRAFGEVVGEIESALRRTQARAAREATVTMLRGKASIRDLISLTKLME